MEYKKFGDDYIIRMNRGEELLTDLQEVCEKEKITLGSVQGIGALGEITIGVFDRKQFKYFTETYKGDFEIASCMGDISTKEGKNYLHIHIVIGNVHEGRIYAGHLSKGIISLTGEFIIHKINGIVEREYSEEVGLNLYKFEK
ncbi:MAG: DNA-binding protein [Acidaminococcaceae bacterium]|jgi:predicted DNA-binding protein with PD1-like motif|nr:DNA-binding protein [Acidaminococcaceae bacterium]